MTKRIIALLLCTLFLLSACSTNDPTETPTAAPSATPTTTPTEMPTASPEPTETMPALSEDELVKLGETFAQEIALGNFDNTFAALSEKIKVTSTKEALAEAYAQVIASVDAYVEPFSSSIEKVGDYFQVPVVLKYETSGVLMLFTFSPQGVIEGLWFNYSPTETPIGESNDVFEEIAIEVGEEPYKLSGFLTLPKNKTTEDVVILIHGSGQSDMDETVGAAENKPFRDIAQGLAEQGIASIRYNKRYYQYPALATYELTIEDEVMEDANAAIKLASSDERINKGKIILAGHSFGGMLGPEIARRNPDTVKAFISLAGTLRHLEDLIYDQNCYLLDTVDLGKTKEELEQIKKDLAAEVDKIKRLSGDETDNFLTIPAVYWHSLNKIDSAKVASELTIPMLIMQGKADFQVYASIDYVTWQTFLSKNKNVEYKLYDNLNHFFMQTNGIKDTTEYDIAGNVDQQVIDDMSAWIISIK